MLRLEGCGGRERGRSEGLWLRNWGKLGGYERHQLGFFKGGVEVSGKWWVMISSVRGKG